MEQAPEPGRIQMYMIEVNIRLCLMKTIRVSRQEHRIRVSRQGCRTRAHREACRIRAHRIRVSRQGCRSVVCRIRAHREGYRIRAHRIRVSRQGCHSAACRIKAHRIKAHREACRIRAHRHRGCPRMECSWVRCHSAEASSVVFPREECKVREPRTSRPTECGRRIRTFPPRASQKR